ncbi:MAG TPA: glycosyltransferase family 4 protein [Cyclobacteriaceae bacterium]|nr:glycosyltransferase family 4 protein [Cyclobacteriaceae bacterium]
MYPKRKIVIIQNRLTHFRKPFFERLKNELNLSGIKLVLIYGQPSRQDMAKHDNVIISWGIEVRNKIIKLGKYNLVWQPCISYLGDADLIIVEQASKLLLNYWLFFTQPFRKAKLCFWGHGKNFQALHVNRFGERIKRWMSRHVHWWFAYNDLSARVILSLGFDERRITSVQNSVDNEENMRLYDQITEDEINRFGKENDIVSTNICLYTGSLYPEKRIVYLLECCHLIRSKIPDFEMIIIGAGPDAHFIEKELTQNRWIHYFGPRFEADKLIYFKVAKLLLMPGLVGLAIVDAFDFETPIVTTDVPYHSPEIDYLIPNTNGIMLKDLDDKEQYANTVVDIMLNTDKLENLKEGCRKARRKYTVLEMVNRFSLGIHKALEKK